VAKALIISSSVCSLKVFSTSPVAGFYAALWHGCGLLTGWLPVHRRRSHAV